jgi:hypothetical protein
MSAKQTILEQVLDATEAQAVPPVEPSQESQIEIDFNDALDPLADRWPTMPQFWDFMEVAGLDYQKPEAKAGIVTFLLLNTSNRPAKQQIKKIAEITRFTEEYINTCISYLRWNDIYHDPGMKINWFDDQTGLAFILDVGVAAGKFRRTIEPGNDPHYVSSSGGWPKFPGYASPPGNPWGESHVARGLMELHGFSLQDAIIATQRGWLNKNMYFYNISEVRIAHAKRWPAIPADLAEFWRQCCAAQRGEPMPRESPKPKEEPPPRNALFELPMPQPQRRGPVITKIDPDNPPVVICTDAAKSFDVFE